MWWTQNEDRNKENIWRHILSVFVCVFSDLCVCVCACLRTLFFKEILEGWLRVVFPTMSSSSICVKVILFPLKFRRLDSHLCFVSPAWGMALVEFLMNNWLMQPPISMYWNDFKNSITFPVPKEPSTKHGFTKNLGCKGHGLAMSCLSPLCSWPKPHYSIFVLSARKGLRRWFRSWDPNVISRSCRSNSEDHHFQRQEIQREICHRSNERFLMQRKNWEKPQAAGPRMNSIDHS